jgi:transcriptional regulator with XRE-family HTH domain
MFLLTVCILVNGLSIKTLHMSFLSQAISDELRRVLRDNKLSVSAAARLLGISRQAFHSYMSGKSIPRPQVLTRADELWRIRIVVGDTSFDPSTFDNQPERPKPAEQLELNLWKKLDAISERDLHISLRREGKTLKVAVSIDIPA